ncbi:MAG: UpxY family transcription antiterminator [Paludibacter sp.]|nr:UpxY family transcription antiterminator [Paludibacter sp.]
MHSNHNSSLQWYVLYTSPRAEKKAEMRIRELDVEVYLPLHKSPRKWSDRIKFVDVPLYSSYIFVHTTHENLYQLLKINGIARIVFFCGVPAVVSPKEINAIHEFIDKTEGLNYTYEINDELKIAFGPLKDMCGKVKKIEKKYIVLIIEQIGVTVVANIDQVIKNKIVST